MYKVRNETKKIPVKVNNNLSLYAACSKIEGFNGGIIINDDKRFVAFWCSYHNKVKIGYGAHQYEREQIKSFYGYK